MLVKNFLRAAVARKNSGPSESTCRRVAADYDIAGYRRIYLVHIRKTGGTSLNSMFLALTGEDPDELYARLGSTRGHRLLSNGKVYLGWNVRAINKGHYYYAFSHTPMHSLNLPEQTFKVTCFRDPVDRVLSHYNMLLEFREKSSNHPCMRIEGPWLGSGFDDFLRRIPKEHLLNQLYMFSSTFDVNQAAAVASKLDHYFFTENFAEGVAELNRKAGLQLKPVHIRKTGVSSHLPAVGLEQLRELLQPEYSFLAALQSRS